MINGVSALLWLPFWGGMVISIVVMIVSVLGNLITLPIIIFLLRNRRDYLIDKLDIYAPKKIQGWAHFPSFAWIRSSQQAFSWFHRHSKEEIQYWRNGIKKELGSVYWLYRLNTECLRFSFLSIFFVFVFMGIEYQFGILGIPF
ncbi:MULTISPECIES: hypothetical protein [unclassified Vibrio]|uniref:hypothetical protein n=1 Tax=unclassified Vibrio TaxID=2614977 RepID=UPI001110D08A|nr:hypothetical protein [Vibrio sp. Hep-1b-8]TMX42694.1 hypothetical protein DA100_07180 [Vibrio sp. Hep-1b-8]